MEDINMSFSRGETQIDPRSVQNSVNQSVPMSRQSSMGKLHGNPRRSSKYGTP